MILVFDDSLRINITDMDKQHERLVSMMNYVYELLRENMVLEAEEYFLSEILSYLEKHFRDEEMFMEKIGFPDLENHKKVHNIFREEVLKLLPAIQSGDIKQFRTALALSWGWIYNHIAKTDRKYANFAIQNGLI